MTSKLLPIALLLLPLPADAAPFCALGTLIGNVTYVQTAEKIELGGVFAIQLQGVAAPEADEPGASGAKAAMRTIALGKKVRCELSGQESYHHCIAVCYLDDVDIGEELIRRGRARGCPRFSGFRYKLAELEAGERGSTISETYDLPYHCRTSRPSPLDPQRSITAARWVGGKGEGTAEVTPASWQRTPPRDSEPPE